MSLRHELERSGNHLFRWRSYWPLLFLPVLLLALRDFRYLGDSAALDYLWEGLCLAVALAGLALRAATVGFVPARTSGRNTRRQVAESLNTLGMYSVVRHPLYVGNFLIGLGIAMFPHDGWLVAIYVLLFALYYERIMFAEEEFLRERFGDEFEQWARRTPAFVPRPSLWRAPQAAFCWRAVLSRENSTQFAIFGVFTLCELLGDQFMGEPFELDPVWTLLFALSLTAYLALRWLKRRGRLHVEGR